MARRRVESAVATLRLSPGLVPCAIALAVFTTWGARDGGFDPLDWVPGALLLVWLLVVYWAAVGGAVRRTRALSLAVAALAALTGWSFASMAWADAPSDAWIGSGKALCYLVVFVLFALRPMRGGVATPLVGAFSVAITGVAIVAFVRGSIAADPTDAFIAGRLATPIDYSNANCALFMIAFWPALWLSTRRDVHPVLRGLMLASAGALLELALMTQSRGSLVAAPIVLAIYLALVPGRLRALVSLAALFVAVWLSAPTIFAVYDAVVGGDGVRMALVDARSALFVSVASLAVAGAAVGLVDRLVELPRWAPRVAAVLAVIVVAVGLIGGGVALTSRYGDPVERTSAWWDSFTSGRYVYEPGTPHLLSGLGTGRYDIWRVAAEIFEAHPVVGAGADNFLREYTRERRVLDDPLYPHSIQLRFLSQLGIVGSALGIGFLIAALWQAVHIRIRHADAGSDSIESGLAAVLVVSFSYWAVHGTIDWFWEIPALAAPAIAFLALAGSLGEPRALAPSGRLVTSGLVALAAVATVVLLPLWVVERDIASAVRLWPTRPEVAFERLDRARALNPWTDRPDVYAATIAGHLGLDGRQRRALRRALDRNGSNWYAAVALAALEARAGRRDAALAALRRAEAANPLDPIVQTVGAEIRAGRPVSEERLQQLFVSRVDLLIGERQS